MPKQAIASATSSADALSRDRTIFNGLYLLIACTLLPSLALVFHTLWSLRSLAVEEAHKSLENLASSVASVQAAKTEQARALLATLASLPEFKALDAARCGETLRNVLADNSGVGNILLTDARGDLVASGRPLAQGMNLADRQVFREALSSGAFRAGQYTRTTQTGISAFPYGRPVAGADGGVVGTLLLALDLKQYAEVFSGIKLQKGSRVALFDRHGVRLTGHSWGSSVMEPGQPTAPANWAAITASAEDSGHFIGRRGDDAQTLAYFRKLRLPGDAEPYMVVVSGAPVDSLAEAAGAALRTNLTQLSIAGALLSCGLLAMLTARVLGRRLVVRHVRELAHSEERQRALFENSLEAIVILRGDDTVAGANPAARAMFRREAHQIEDLPFERLLADGQGVLPPPESGQGPGKSLLETTLRRADGTPFRAEVARSAYVSGGEPLVSLFIRDIEDRKQAERALIAAKNQAEEASKAKSDFLANVSHELRTPMNAILGFTDLVRNGVAPERSVEFAGHAHQSGLHLLDIMNDMLDVSRIEAGQMELRPADFSLREVVETACRYLEPQARSKNLDFRRFVDPEAPDRLRGDSGRLMQVLVNVAGNAVKFTDHGRVSVTASLAGEPGEDGVRLLFVVQDEGIGIPPDKLEEVFTPFSRAGSSVHALYGGTGLGLSISRSIVERMDGSIWAESEPAQGATIRFTVRLDPPRGDDVPAPAPDGPPGEEIERLRVLVAEDNPINRTLAVTLLRTMGHEAAEAADGREALELLAKERFDLVLMDVRMPVMDGLEATRLLREGRAGDPGVPVVALTAFSQEGDDRRFADAGMDGFISKPVTQGMLRFVLQRIARPARPGAPREREALRDA